MQTSIPPKRRATVPKWKRDWHDLAHVAAGLGGLGEAWVYVRKNWRVVKRYWVLFVVLVGLSSAGAFWLGRTSVPQADASIWQVDPMEWPPLSAAEISEWAAELRKHSPPSECQLWYQEPLNAKRFLRSFQAVGKQSGFKVQYLNGQSETADITVTARPNNPFAAALARLLRKYKTVRVIEGDEYETNVGIWLPEEG